MPGRVTRKARVPKVAVTVPTDGAAAGDSMAALRDAHRHGSTLRSYQDRAWDHATNGGNLDASADARALAVDCGSTDRLDTAKEVTSRLRERGYPAKVAAKAAVIAAAVK